MKHFFFPLFFFLSMSLIAETTFTGSDCPTTPAIWPPWSYEMLQVTFQFVSDDLDVRGIYCDFMLPSGNVIGTYATDVDEEGVGIFSFASSVLRHYGEEGSYTLGNLRVLTPEGFASIPGAYVTQEYKLEQFRPACQSTLLSRDNGVEVELKEKSLGMSFLCPENTTTLPAFLFQEATVFDGYAVAIDSCLEDISFCSGAEGLFSTPTYSGCDVTSSATEYLATQGDGDPNLDPGENLLLGVPIQWNGCEYGAEDPEDFVYLVLFYHSTEQEFVDPDAMVVHPFDRNCNFQITKTELDEGQELWIKGEVTPQFLLEAIPLCDATTYEYDDSNGCFYPYWP